MKGRKRIYGLRAAAFGAGLLLALCLPAKFLVIFLAVMIVVCGILLSRR